MPAAKKTAKKTAKKSVKKAACKKSTTKKGAKLSAAHTATLRKLYAKAHKEVGPLEAGYAVRSTPTKIQGMCASPDTDLLKQKARLLHRVLRDATKNKFKLAPKSFSAITAALVYFLNPFDVIPDHVEGMGQLDDLYIIDLAAKDAKADLLKYCRAKKLDPGDYGLKA